MFTSIEDNIGQLVKFEQMIYQTSEMHAYLNLIHLSKIYLLMTF